MEDMNIPFYGPVEVNGPLGVNGPLKVLSSPSSLIVNDSLSTPTISLSSVCVDISGSDLLKLTSGASPDGGVGIASGFDLPLSGGCSSEYSVFGSSFAW